MWSKGWQKQTLVYTFYIDSVKVDIVDTHFVEHFLEIFLWVDPWCYSITEKDEVLYHSSWVDTDHVAHTTEGRIFLLIITDITQWCAPKEKIHSNHNIIQSETPRNFIEQLLATIYMCWQHTRRAKVLNITFRYVVIYMQHLTINNTETNQNICCTVADTGYSLCKEATQNYGKYPQAFV